MELMKSDNVAEYVVALAREYVHALKSYDTVPVLGVVRYGNGLADISYEKSLAKYGDLAGVQVKFFSLSSGTAADTFAHVVGSLNTGYHGILVMRPFPKDIVPSLIYRKIDINKDIDGFRMDNPSYIEEVREYRHLYPCTADACLYYLACNDITVNGKLVVVMGRSSLVGSPLAVMLRHRGAMVTVCNSGTSAESAMAATRSADIVISCAGKPNLFGKDYFRDGQIIVDIGCSYDGAKMCGDVNAAELTDLDVKISPVPGGIGKITSAVAMYHTAVAAHYIVTEQL